MANTIYPVDQLAIQLELQLRERLKHSPVLLVTSGGSVLRSVAQVLSKLDNYQSNLTMTLLDERWDKISNHPKSNWQSLLRSYAEITGKQLEQSGINLKPVFASGVSLADTVAEFNAWLVPQLASQVITIFGLGADGHTAGILPHPMTSRIFTSNVYLGYAVDKTNVDMTNLHLDPEIHFRITPGFGLLNRLLKESVWLGLYAQGESKRAPLTKLLGYDHLTRCQFPAVILREHLDRINIFTDQLLDRNHV